jgi:uncharacterized membrane protein
MATVATPAGDHVLHDVKRIAKLEAERVGDVGALERLSQRISAFAGSPRFVLTHAAWFAAWIGWNTLASHRIDPYPFTFLTFLVSLEAIFLTSFVLISQNHLEQQAHRRAALDLQINLLAEKEMTRVLNGIIAIADRLGIAGVCDDPESRQMATDTNIEAIAAAVDATVGEEGANDHR